MGVPGCCRMAAALPGQQRSAGPGQGRRNVDGLQSCRGLHGRGGGHLPDDEQAERVDREQPRPGAGGQGQSGGRRSSRAARATRPEQRPGGREGCGVEDSGTPS